MAELGRGKPHIHFGTVAAVIQHEHARAQGFGHRDAAIWQRLHVLNARKCAAAEPLPFGARILRMPHAQPAALGEHEERVRAKLQAIQASLGVLIGKIGKARVLGKGDPFVRKAPGREKGRDRIVGDFQVRAFHALLSRKLIRFGDAPDEALIGLLADPKAAIRRELKAIGAVQAIKEDRMAARVRPEGAKRGRRDAGGVFQRHIGPTASGPVGDHVRPHVPPNGKRMRLPSRGEHKPAWVERARDKQQRCKCKRHARDGGARSRWVQRGVCLPVRRCRRRLARVAGHVHAEEVARFDALAARWWDPEGPFWPLHRLNPLRLAYIQEHAGALAGKNVLDLGCGGGILAEALAREGAHVEGIDASARAIAVARAHAEEQGLLIRYEQTDPISFAQGRKRAYDLIVCMELLEHVPDPAAVVAAAARMLKPGGLFVFSTINRTPKAFLFAIVGAEYILGWLPRGTHRYEKLVRPSEVALACRHAGLRLVDLRGLCVNPITRTFRFCDDLSVNYFGCARAC